MFASSQPCLSAGGVADRQLLDHVADQLTLAEVRELDRLERDPFDDPADGDDYDDGVADHNGDHGDGDPGGGDGGAYDARGGEDAGGAAGRVGPVGGPAVVPSGPGRSWVEVLAATVASPGLAARLDQVLPGTLAGLSGAELAEVICSAGRLVSWAQAGQAAAVAERARRADGGSAGRGFEVEETATDLHLSGHAAHRLHARAVALHTRLAATAELFTSGALDQARVDVIVEATAPLDPDTARRVQGRVLPAALRQNPAQLRATLRRAILAVDPGAAEQVLGVQVIRPGCTRPATRCELDHLIPFPRGTTSTDNLHPLCTHHHLKLDSDWQVRAILDGLEWTSPSGRTHQVHAHDHRPEPTTPARGAAPSMATTEIPVGTAALIGPAPAAEDDDDPPL